jgi:hypothetical protein
MNDNGQRRFLASIDVPSAHFYQNRKTPRAHDSCDFFSGVKSYCPGYEDRDTG